MKIRSTRVRQAAKSIWNLESYFRSLDLFFHESGISAFLQTLSDAGGSLEVK